MSFLTAIKKDEQWVEMEAHKILAWFKQEYVHVEPVVYAVLVEVEQHIQNGDMDKLVGVLSGLAPQYATMAQGFVAILKNKLPYYLNDVTLIQNFPQPHTPDDVKALAQALINTYPKLTDTKQGSKMATAFVNLCAELDAFLETPVKKTFMDYINEFIKVKGIIQAAQN